MTCAQCGGDQSTCGCTPEGSLLDFLSDFRGRERAVVSSPLPTTTQSIQSLPPLLPNSDTGPTGPTPVPYPDASRAAERPAPARAPAPPVKEPDARTLRLPSLPSEIPQLTQLKDWAATLPSPSQITWLSRIRSVSWEDNPAATASTVFGLMSLYLPLLAVPSIALAIICLRRLPVQPWRQGKARAITGIVSSVILAPISVFIWMSIL